MAMASSPAADPTTVPCEPGGPFEVVDGQIVEISTNGALDTWIASRLNQALGPFATEHRLGKVVVGMLFPLDPDHNINRRPDVAFVSCERWPLDQRIPRRSAWEVVPDLVVEVVSPADRADAILDRTAEYFRAGATLVWVVFPSQNQVYVYESPTRVRILQPGDELDGGTCLPGFRFALGELFEGQSSGAR
jgi:Uma2 family endonuclease